MLEQPTFYDSGMLTDRFHSAKPPLQYIIPVQYNFWRLFYRLLKGKKIYLDSHLEFVFVHIKQEPGAN